LLLVLLKQPIIVTANYSKEVRGEMIRRSGVRFPPSTKLTNRFLLKNKRLVLLRVRIELLTSLSSHPLTRPLPTIKRSLYLLLFVASWVNELFKLVILNQIWFILLLTRGDCVWVCLCKIRFRHLFFGFSICKLNLFLYYYKSYMVSTFAVIIFFPSAVLFPGVEN
jgi:hypothetical protein